MRFRGPALCMLAACGRFGFDAIDDGGGSGSGSDDAGMVTLDGPAPDGVTAMSCTATRVADVMLTPPVTNVIAAKTPGGYSLGFITGASSFLSGVFVSDTLTPNTDMPHRTSPVPGFTFTYSRASMFWTGSVLVGATSVVEDGNCYKKIFPTEMTIYEYADNGQQCRHGEPSVAVAGTTVLSTWFEDDQHLFMALAADGMPQNPEMSAGVLAGTIVDTSVASGITAVIATSFLGTCEVRQIPVVRGQSLSADACSKPHIVNAGDVDRWLVVYQNNANVMVRALGYVGAAQDLTVSSGADLGPGQSPRLFRGPSGWLVAIASSGLAIHDIDPVGTVPISGLPATPLDAFEVAGDAIFAAYGADLYAIRCD